MATSAADEPPIDVSLAHYMEQRALEIAADKAATAEERATVARLSALRATLMGRRDAFMREATARRHARGEIYSAARVAAINAMGSSREKLEDEVRVLYGRRKDASDVLRAHARVHFAHGLVSARQALRYATPDIADALHAMRRDEEAFARAWIGAAGDAAFADEMRRAQRSASIGLRTATRPMHLVSQPPTDTWADDDALLLGKAWNRLDQIATDRGVAPLSNFIALPDEPSHTLASADDLLATVDSLLAALEEAQTRLPSRKALLALLARMRLSLTDMQQRGGRVGFEIDF